MITLYLVRHGETLFNQFSLMQGWCDSPLTQKGMEQAEGLAKRLKNIPFTAAYSSTSERAMDTANIILQEHSAVTLQPRKEFKELNFGLYEGAPQYLAHNHPAFTTYDYTSVGGDSRETLVERMMKGLSYVVDHAKDGEHIIVVSHGAAIMNVILHLDPVVAKAMKRNPKSPGIRNCSAHAISYENGVFKVQEVNIDLKE